MRLIRGVWRALRLALAALGGLWSVLMMLLMAGSLALSIAMTVIPAVFAAVSGVVESVTGIRSLATRQVTREAALTDDLVRANRLAATEAAERRAATGRADNLARELAASRTAQARMAREMANSPVTYRGSRMAAREAVKDTADRVARRTAIATTRNIASMPGEALPVIGVGVIAAATAWELSDACAMMGEMRALDAAFNPDDPVTPDEVCGMKVPTRAELWQMIKSSPGAVWEGAKAMYDGLPDVALTRGYDRSMTWLGGAWDGMFGDDPAPETPSDLHSGPNTPATVPPPSDLNPLNWFDGQ